MNWRRWNFILHRDIGYLCIGLTLIYGVSGIAVNHISPRFNPSYTVEKSTAQVPPLNPSAKPDMEYIQAVLNEIGETGKFKNAAFVSPGILRIFVDTNTLDVETASGRVNMEKVNRKPLLFEANYLHLNKGKGIWTLLADVYGAALCLLAITGLLMIRGKRKMRGLLLSIAGFLIPVIYLITVL
ncbi:MAG: PepSY-associated TM helix domain-containing protein [Desulforhopalus sp.]